jgi:hypothetical protein
MHEYRLEFMGGLFSRSLAPTIEPAGQEAAG